MFITIEGIDGSGKTTQSALLANYLRSESKSEAENIILTREPGGTDFTEATRELLLKNDQINSVAELLLLISMRKEHVEKLINPALKNGKVVICDRFIDSTVAYQGYGYGIDIKIIKKLHQMAEILYPNITFILDVEVNTGLQRVTSKNKYEKMDEDFYHRVRNGFRDIAKKNSDRCHIITLDSDNSDSNCIHNKILTILKPALPLPKEAYELKL